MWIKSIVRWKNPPGIKRSSIILLKIPLKRSWTDHQTPGQLRTEATGVGLLGSRTSQTLTSGGSEWADTCSLCPGSARRMLKRWSSWLGGRCSVRPGSPHTDRSSRWRWIVLNTTRYPADIKLKENWILRNNETNLWTFTHVGLFPQQLT